MKIYYFFSLFILLILNPFRVDAITVSPAIIDLQLDPGDSITREITLYNETTDDLFIDGVIEKFVPNGENGQADILPFDITDSSVNWIKLPINSLVLKVGEGITVPVIVTVPVTADVGGYYLAVMWQSSTAPKTEKSHQTLIASRVGVLMLLGVNGEINNNLEINNFELRESKDIYTNTSIDFLLRLRNIGNIHLKPQGSVIIKNFLGKTVEVLPINQEQRAILPNSNRIFNTAWHADSDQFNFISKIVSQLTDFSVGRFSAKAIVDYGNDQSIESKPIYFWVIPWPLILLVIVSLVLIVGFVVKIKNKNK